MFGGLSFPDFSEGKVRNNRWWRRAAALLALAITSQVGGPLVDSASSAPGRPNILFIVTDDQRRDTMSALPATRRIFEGGGRRFTNAFATTPVCCPSRSSIFTGQYVHNHGIKTNRTKGLNEDATIQRYLDGAGYRTATFGKFLNSWDVNDNPKYWDRWAIFPKSKYGYKDDTWNVNGTVRTVSGYSNTFIMRKTVQFIRSSEKKDSTPFFLNVAVPAPHAPFIPQRKYADARVSSWGLDPAVNETDTSDKPAYVQSATANISAVQKVRAAQMRTLMSVDDLVGRIFHALTANGETSRTLAIFISDNGFMWGEHGLFNGSHSKSNPYTQSIGVPMMMRWPGHIAARSVDQRLVANIDMAPTVLDAANVTPDPQYPMDGMSLLSFKARNHLLAEFWPAQLADIPQWAAIRGLRSEYVEYYSSDGSVLFTEYYNLADDPWQLNNLLADKNTGNDPDVTALSNELAADRTCSGKTCP